MHKYQKKDKCPLCVEYYETEIRIPKILKCGHTFCLQCLSGFVVYLLRCPTCYTPIKEPLIQLITNYAVFSEESTNDRNKLQLKMESLVKLSDEQNKHASEKTQILTESKDKLNIIIETLEQCNNIKEDCGDEFDKKLREIEENRAKIQLKLLSCYKPEIKPTITLSSYPTKEEFICNIAVRVFKEKNVYAFNSELNKNKIYWGKLSCKEGKLYIHTFTSDLPLYPCTFVPFRDLKKCMTIDNFRIFIDVSDHHLVCTMLTSSKLAKTFIKHCSGEEGKSLNGVKSFIKKIPNLKHGVVEIEDDCFQNIVNEDYEFLNSLPSKTDEKFDDLLQIRISLRFGMGQNLDLVEDKFDELIIASAQPNTESMLSDSGSIQTWIDNCGILILLPINQSSKNLDFCSDFKLSLMRESISRPISKPISRLVSLEEK